MNTISVDSTKCNGSANCALICPEVFELDEDIGKSHVLQEHAPEDLVPWVQQAVDQCPQGAISLTISSGPDVASTSGQRASNGGDE